MSQLAGFSAERVRFLRVGCRYQFSRYYVCVRLHNVFISANSGNGKETECVHLKAMVIQLSRPLKARSRVTVNCANQAH
jgi:hypothetical protein